MEYKGKYHLKQHRLVWIRANMSACMDDVLQNIWERPYGDLQNICRVAEQRMQVPEHFLKRQDIFPVMGARQRPQVVMEYFALGDQLLSVIEVVGFCRMIKCIKPVMLCWVEFSQMCDWYIE